MRKANQMLRIIALRTKEGRWLAHWQDEPSVVVSSGSMLGAAARLLIETPERGVSPKDVEIDPMAAARGREELVVIPRNPGEKEIPPPKPPEGPKNPPEKFY